MNDKLVEQEEKRKRMDAAIITIAKTLVLKANGQFIAIAFSNTAIDTVVVYIERQKEKLNQGIVDRASSKVDAIGQEV